ncbi:helix-turn-helix domain-containing protein [Intestinibacillus massiliensis]|uniref:helix-turn-helix domain-containing protein n=1 Tax=Intestinibacillus massiliensis TaxID=1871029 RepID=UPI000B360CA5|nr:helix-turn-helix transcriptional regulator [Intestinibacillus massiliensis]MCB6364934.1 helix-turn-helix domain-containing protein [Intestinibacillus massiliensis]
MTKLGTTTCPNAQKVFGANVERYRKLAGLSKFQLAIDADVDVKHLRAIERGEHNPTLVTIERIANALGVTIGKLFDITGQTDTFPLSVMQPAFNRLPPGEQTRVLSILRLLVRVNDDSDYLR